MAVAVAEPSVDTGEESGLGAQAARGGFAVVVGQLTRIVIQVASVSVLARLLSPSDYGLVAIVLAVVGVGEIFRDFGLSTAAVQAKTVSRAQRDTLFWVNTGIGLVLTLATVALAPVVADIFGHSSLVGVTRALAVTFLLNGMAAQHEADLTRHLRFGALVTVNVGTQALGTVVAIVVAAAGGGYWALVAQQVGTGVATLIWLVALTRWIPRLPRRSTDIRPFVRFGAGLALSQVIGYLNSNVDTVTIGLRFSASQLGLYNRGYQLLMKPLGQLRAPTTSIALPVMRLVGDDRERSDDVLIRGQRALGYSLVAGVAITAGASQPIVRVFLGDRWTSVAPVFALLAVAGIFQTISYVGNWVYLSRGLTGKLVWYSLVSLAIKIVCVIVGSAWGIVGVAAGFALAPALAWPISLWWLGRLTDLPLDRLYAGSYRILGAAAFSGGVAYAVVWALQATPELVQLLASVTGGGAAYLLLALVSSTYRKEMSDVLRTVTRALKGRRR